MSTKAGPPSTDRAAPGGPRVVVLGAGIIGVAVAGELARRGGRVTLLESRRLGLGATQASAGMLAPFTEAEPGTVLSRLCAEGLAEYDEAVARARRDSGCEFEYARNGTVEVALDAASAAHFRDTQRALSEQGIACTWRDRESALAAHPAATRAMLGVLEIAPHGFVAVMPFARALLRAAQAYGATVIEGVTAQRVRGTRGRLDIVAGPDTFDADHVVICTGSWSPQLAVEGDEDLAVRPVRGQLLELRPRESAGTRILWGPRCYLVPWSTGALLVGATVEDVGFDERTTTSGIASLIDAAVELVPSLADAAFVEARVGLRPASIDGLPIVGASAAVPGVIYATGHYRNGVLLAPLTARIVADLVLEGRAHPALDALSPARFAARVRP